MSFYAKLGFNQNDLDREYVVRTASGREYKFIKSSAELNVDSEAGMLIFTDENNYRVALNYNQIESVTWDKSKEGN